VTVEEQNQDGDGHGLNGQEGTVAPGAERIAMHKVVGQVERYGQQVQHHAHYVDALAGLAVEDLQHLGNLDQHGTGDNGQSQALAQQGLKAGNCGRR